MITPRAGFRRLALACALWSTASAVAADDPLDTVEKASETWVQTRLETSRLETGWVAERELLQSTLAAYTERATAQEEKRDLLKSRTAKEREELDTLRSRVAAAREDLTRFEARLQAIRPRLERLRPTLPPRLSDGLDDAYRTLAKPDLTPGERAQITLTILSRCAQFDRTLTRGEEVLPVDAGQKPLLVDVLYWGLSHAYALDRSTHRVWLGHPVADRWKWESQPGSDGNFRAALAIYDGKADPEFVLMPAVAGSTKEAK